MYTKKRLFRNFFSGKPGHASYGLVFSAVTASLFFGWLGADIFGRLTRAGYLCSAAFSQPCHPTAALSALITPNSLVETIAIGTIAVIVAYLVGIVFSHRIFGALIPIERHITHLANGNYQARVKLRSTDHLKTLSAQLNQLAEALEKRNQAEPPDGGAQKASNHGHLIPSFSEKD